MTITLFERTLFAGDSGQIADDQDDLRQIPVGRNPTHRRDRREG